MNVLSVNVAKRDMKERGRDRKKQEREGERHKARDR